MVIKKHWWPKIHEPKRNYLNKQEYSRVIQAAETHSLQDRFLIHFLFSSGCRGLEISNLNIKNVNLENRIVELKGKVSKKRYVRFSEECASVLGEYLKTRSGDSSEPLFINKYGKRLQLNGIYNVTKKLGHMAGLLQVLTPSCCRRTYLRYAVEEGLSDLNIPLTYEFQTLYVGPRYVSDSYLRSSGILSEFKTAFKCITKSLSE
ncbi:tyrosine-type recombinase/integrase [Cytobacillus sp. Bac17]|uniref:tyrosine-type recombinase/integrase n=1 Tax=Cytobacillus sp. Bac17 TaxID=2926008 RepID=UPI002118A971|nr:tyrosine-type recombinase/integrase [Cytobacillus sp. Bac17]